jgi:hypothetical protein
MALGRERSAAHRDGMTLCAARWGFWLSWVLIGCTSPPSARGGQTGEGGGPYPGCGAESWKFPDREPISAQCFALWPEAGLRGRWACSCDVRTCPTHARGWDDALRRLDPRIEPCLVETATEGATTFWAECLQAVREVCDLPPDASSYCGRYATPPAVGSDVCITQRDGTHQCSCQGTAAVSVADSDCELALRAACGPAECENDAGSCLP